MTSIRMIRKEFQVIFCYKLYFKANKHQSMSSSKYIKKVAVIFDLSTTSLRQLFNNPQRNE